MKFLRKILDDKAPLFEKGGKLEKLYPLYEANDTLLFTPGEKTHGHVHVRDGIDLKRMMITVVVALTPCVLMSMYNTGLQAELAIAAGNGSLPAGFKGALAEFCFGLFSLTPGVDPTLFSNILFGACMFIPIYAVFMFVGGHVEVVFCVIRKHEINEGFLVTGLLLPLTLPPDIPLWMVGASAVFGVVLGKEVFGGTGMNFLNPALTARAFLFFAHAGVISGDKVWVGVDGFSGPTPLASAQAGGLEQLEADFSWLDSFFGTIPGSIGETSTLACLLGAGVLIATGIGSWRIMLSSCIGLFVMSLLLNLIGANGYMEVPAHWHFVIGGFAFGMVFMATDPVTAAITDRGKWIYGFLIGVLCVLVRVLNPAYPEGMMLAILFMNIFAPLIDYFVVKGTIKRREVRLGVQ